MIGNLIKRVPATVISCERSSSRRKASPPPTGGEGPNLLFFAQNNINQRRYVGNGGIAIAINIRRIMVI